MTSSIPNNKQPIVWHSQALTRTQREQHNGHRGMVVWLTGLPGSGKSSIASVTQMELHRKGFQTALLDGDNLRHGLCADLGFSSADRNEHVRRVGEVARLLLEQGVIVLVALVSPLRGARDKVRQTLAEGDFFEVWCQCPVSVCATRDPKGHYAQAQSGQIAEFTGVSSSYQEPLQPALVLDTAVHTLEESVYQLVERLELSRQTPQG